MYSLTFRVRVTLP